MLMLPLPYPLTSLEATKRGIIFYAPFTPGYGARPLRLQGIDSNSAEAVDAVGTYVNTNGVLRQAMNGVARIEKKGVLIEGAVQIKCDYDVQPSGSWVLDTVGPAEIVATENTTDVLDPLGTNTATRFDFDAVDVGAGERSQLAQTASAGNVQISCSMWLRGAVGGEVIYLHLLNGNGTASTSTECILTTRWQKFRVVGAGRRFALLGVDTRGTGHQNQPIQTVYAFGAYVDAGGLNFVTSTIIGAFDTTRDPDDIRFDNTNEIHCRAARGSFACLATPLHAGVAGDDAYLFDVRAGGGGAGTDHIRLKMQNNGTYRYTARSNSVEQTLTTAALAVANTTQHVLIVWEDNNFRIDIDGVTRVTDGSGSAPRSFTSAIQIGQRSGQLSPWFGNIAHPTIFDKALTVSEGKGLYDSMKNWV